MEAFSLLSWLGAAAAIVAASVSVTRVWLKIQTQKKLAQALHRTAADNLVLRIEQSRDPDELKRLKEQLDRAVQSILESFPSSDRKRILEGLARPSEEGRTEYIKNVLSHAK